MGLSNFPSLAEGMLPLLVMNTVMSVALVKNMFRSVLQVVGSGGAADQEFDGEYSGGNSDSRPRRVSISRYGSLCRNRCGCSSGGGGNTWAAMECCVCLSGFKAEEEVSELSCKHFFHKGCLDKWFDNQQISCPLCRSVN